MFWYLLFVGVAYLLVILGDSGCCLLGVLF